MSDTPQTQEERHEVLLAQAAESEQTLEAIRLGQVDALVVEGPTGPQVFTLKTIDELEAEIILLTTLQESSPDGILVVDSSAKVISRNRRFLEMWRIPEMHRDNSEDGLLLARASEQLKNPAEFLSRIAYLYAHPNETSRELIEMSDGRVFDRYSSPMFDSSGLYLGRVWFFRDITEQREGEKRLTLFRTLVDESNDTVEVIDPETLQLLDVNERACVDLGYTHEELVSKHVPDIDVSITPEQIRVVQEQLRSVGKAVFESAHRRKDGSIFPVELSLTLVSTDRPYIVAVVRDITERRRGQKALEESETRFRTLIENASDPVAIVETDGTIRYASPASVRMSGYELRELVGRNVADFVHPDDAGKVAEQFIAVTSDPERVQYFVARLRREDDTLRTVEATLRNLFEVSPINGFVLNFRDVTVRERSARALAALTATDSAMVRATDERSLAEQICRIMVEIGGYRMAWIGSPEHDERKTISVIAQAGESGDYFKVAQFSWADSPCGGGPSGVSVRTGRTTISREYIKSVAAAEQQAEASKRGFEACIAIPLLGNNRIPSVITLYANDPMAFDDDEVRLLEQLSADLSYGIEAIRERENHAIDLERLENNLEATIQAIAAMVETRDPYTAGHERRVAGLCVAIARELGLSPERIRALQLAASIHDVGKIKIPTEILVKPGGLSPIEYTLVQLHPQAGYEILKNIDFPWPIAQMVEQHHEKLDGSGYPHGLYGEQILLESRILAVADVVEAMSSHRPYRPGWGIDVALAEVERGKGTQFDAAVVNACTKLFREKGFRLG